MTRKIEHVSRVDYQSMTGIERREHGFEGLYNQWMCTEFFADDDNYDLYEDIDDKDNHDMRKYAVYQRSTGELKCLVGDAAMALDLCYDDNDFRDKRHELYRQIAIAAGWPENMTSKKRYTVRINRYMDVEVYAADREQALVIGRKLAYHANHRSTNLGASVRHVMNSCDFEAADAWEAPDEDDGVWDLTFNVAECNKILKEG